MKKLASISVMLFALTCLTGAGWLPLAQQAAVTYQGPGDVVGSAIYFGSPARAYNAAYANGTNPLADLVDSAAPTTVICTLRVLTTGFVDLAGNYCTGSLTPAAKCAAATGGVCNINKIYDQAGATGGWTSTTAANQPTLSFSALNGLPGVSCAGSGRLDGVNPVTQAVPFTHSTVFKRTANFTTSGGINTFNTTVFGLTSDIIANSIRLVNNGASVINDATHSADSVFHAVSGVSDSPSSLNVDGNDSSSLNATTNISALTARWCRDANTIELTGIIMEVGMWPSSFSSGQRTNLNSNMHSATNGYNF